jgi:hypothetical protein
VIVPTLAVLSAGIPWLVRVAATLVGRLSTDAQEWLASTPRRSPCVGSFFVAGLLLFVSPWMGNLAGHNQDLIPSKSLDKLLELYRGEHVFNFANWGGYLSWHGWDLKPRFKTWIDDRLDIHGRVHTEEYRTILNAKPGWEELLRKTSVDVICIPPNVPLANRVRETPGWQLILDDGKVVIFRRSSSSEGASSAPSPEQSHPYPHAD